MKSFPDTVVSHRVAGLPVLPRPQQVTRFLGDTPPVMSWTPKTVLEAIHANVLPAPDRALRAEKSDIPVTFTTTRHPEQRLIITWTRPTEQEEWTPRYYRTITGTWGNEQYSTE